MKKHILQDDFRDDYIALRKHLSAIKDEIEKMSDLFSCEEWAYLSGCFEDIKSNLARIEIDWIMPRCKEVTDDKKNL